jgi:hypothetical protein
VNDFACGVNIDLSRECLFGGCLEQSTVQVDAVCQEPFILGTNSLLKFFEFLYKDQSISLNGKTVLL